VDAEIYALSTYFSNHLTGFDRDRLAPTRGAPAL